MKIDNWLLAIDYQLLDRQTYQLNPNFFTKDSPFLNHPLLTEERTAAEVDFVLQHADASANARFLDVGCGFGRHSLELAKRGYQVIGIDPAEAMIKAANEYNAQLDPYIQSNVDFFVQDGESYQSDEKFDVVICLMTTLGQVGPSGGNTGLLNAIYANLKSGGKLFLEIPQKEATVHTLKAKDHFGSDTHYTAIKREYDQTNSRIVERFSIVSPENQRDFLLSYRLFSQNDIEQMLAKAGFKIDLIVGDFSGNPLTADSLNMVFIAKA